MEKRKEIVAVLRDSQVGDKVTVMGWVRAFRSNRFVALNDGSTSKTLQIVADEEKFEESLLKKLYYHSCIKASGTIVESKGSEQAIELLADQIEIFGEVDPEVYPIKPARQTLDFLRQKAHFRMRTNVFGSVFRIRHATAYAIHKYFNDRGYYYMNTPIITASDAEGAGEMFRVTTLPLQDAPTTEKGEIDWSQDFFGSPTNLTVSGQLQAEVGALALGKVYTFGPTFRAENSNTSRHLSEFWMIEPEVAFADLEDDMDLAEDFLKYLMQYILDNCRDDLDVLEGFIKQQEKGLKKEERRDMGLIETIEFILANDFERISYTDAINLLRNSKPYKKKRFEYDVAWGKDLQAEHERWLVEKKFKKPVIVYDYPKEIKAFYMRMNEDDKTVAAMDVLFPGIGEVVGGSQREERYDVLLERVKDFDIPEEELWWYLELRQFGGAPHAGFGLGFERMVQFLTGMKNIRDVIPFPRAPKTADF